MKKKGIAVNVFITLGKALPIAIASGILFAMVAYIVCVNLFPLEYRSSAEFIPDFPSGSGFENVEVVATDVFYERVAEEYSAERSPVSSDTVKRMLNVSRGADGIIRISAMASNSATAYFTVCAALRAADHFYKAQEGSISITSNANIPTELSRRDISVYLIYSAVVGAALVVIVALLKGLTLFAVASEREFSRTCSGEILGTVPHASKLLDERINNH